MRRFLLVMVAVFMVGILFSGCNSSSKCPAYSQNNETEETANI